MPPALGVIVTGVDAVTALVAIAKVALVAPCAIVTPAGTVAAALPLDRERANPPAGAGDVSVTVPCAEAPPVTLAGFTDTAESDAGGGGAGGGVTVSVALRIPARVERVRGIHAATVPADLHHLRPAPQRQIRRGGMRGATHDAAQVDRSGLVWVVRVADVVLLELSGSPARHVQPAVVDRQVDIRHQRRDRAARLQRRRELRGIGGGGPGGG